MNGRAVNEKGYLINNERKYVINKYNQNLMFKKEDLTPDGKLPMPYRFEMFNFNPHDIMGHFDFDKNKEKPIILKNKHG